jgi:hypothetical protein
LADIEWNQPKGWRQGFSKKAVAEQPGSGTIYLHMEGSVFAAGGY